MSHRTSVSEHLVLAVLAALAWFGVLLQLVLSLRLAQATGQSIADGLVAYSGYFTVLSNLLVALVASAGLLATRGFLASGSLRGCATTAIVLVGIGYHVLLRQVWDPQGWQRVADYALHYAVPLASLAYWLLFPPRRPLALLAPLAWLLYPLAYFAYVMVRGEVLGSYPYYFIDVTRLGYGAVLANALGFLAGFVAMGFVVRQLAGFRRTRAGAAPRPGL